MLDVNSLDAALRCFFLSPFHSRFEADRCSEHDLVENPPGNVVVPDVGDRAFWLIIYVPSVDNERGERRRKDIDVADFGGRPRLSVGIGSSFLKGLRFTREAAIGKDTDERRSGVDLGQFRNSDLRSNEALVNGAVAPLQC